MKKTDLQASIPQPGDHRQAEPSPDTLPVPLGPKNMDSKDLSSKDLARGNKLIEIAGRIEQERRDHVWTDAIACARDIALACLPRRKTDAKMVEKTIQFAPDCEVTVRYSVPENRQMPYGADRFVFFGIQHLARTSDSPLVEFQKAGALLDMFGLPDSGAEYRRLRARFARLRSLNIEIETRGTGTMVPKGTEWGIGARFIEEWSLPSRKAVDAELAGQRSLLTGRSPYYVRLSDSLFSRVQKNNPEENVLILRLDLLKHFRDSPIGWDYCVFLMHRCGSARSISVVPHDVLMKVFKAGKETDPQTIERLQKYHREIKVATGDNLNAELIVVREQRKGRGRPKKIWGLRVGPSKGIVNAGRRFLKNSSGG